MFASDLTFFFFRTKASQAQSSHTKRHANVRFPPYLCYPIPAYFRVGMVLLFRHYIGSCYWVSDDIFKSFGGLAISTYSSQMVVSVHIF